MKIEIKIIVTETSIRQHNHQGHEKTVQKIQEANWNFRWSFIYLKNNWRI